MGNGKVIHEFRVPFERFQRPQGPPYVYGPQYYFMPGATSERDVVDNWLEERRKQKAAVEMARVKHADIVSQRVEAETEAMRRMREQAREFGYNVEFRPIAEGQQTQTQQGPAQPPPQPGDNPLISLFRHFIDKADESEKDRLQAELRRLEDKIGQPGTGQGGNSLNALLKSMVEKMGEQDKDAFLTRVESIVKGSGGGQSELINAFKTAFDSLSQANRQALLAEVKAMLPAPSGGGGDPLSAVDKILDIIDRRTPKGGGMPITLEGGGNIAFEDLMRLLDWRQGQERIELRRDMIRGSREVVPAVIEAVGNTIREIRTKSPSSTGGRSEAEAQEVDVPCPACKAVNKVKPGQEVVTCHECGAEIHLRW